jgi:hypothetical protein
MIAGITKRAFVHARHKSTLVKGELPHEPHRFLPQYGGIQPAFESLAECLTDAMDHGYGGVAARAGPPRESRQRRTR